MSVTAQIVRVIKTNIWVLVFLTMGVTAHLIGMQDRFSNKLCCRFSVKTIQNYVANTMIIMSNDQLGFCVSNCCSVKIVSQQWLNPILIMCQILNNFCVSCKYFWANFQFSSLNIMDAPGSSATCVVALSCWTSLIAHSMRRIWQQPTVDSFATWKSTAWDANSKRMQFNFATKTHPLKNSLLNAKMMHWNNVMVCSEMTKKTMVHLQTQHQQMVQLLMMALLMEIFNLTSRMVLTK